MRRLRRRLHASSRRASPAPARSAASPWWPTRRRCAQDPPVGVLPFLIGDQEARRLVGDWLKGLWFAPSGIAEQARGPGRLHGVYLPYWTYDSRTRTRYVGQRGDVYYETAVCRRRRRRPPGAPGGAGAQGPLAAGPRPGRARLRRRAGARRQHAAGASGRGAGALGPGGMRPYTPDYLSGFEGELYQLPVDQGFERGQAIDARR